MEHYLHLLIEYLRQHPLMGQTLTFIIALLESLPIIGTLVPGSVTMTAIGTLIGAHILPPTLTFLCAILGAFCGDCISFWLGSHFKEKIPRIWPFKNHQEWLITSENFFSRHGGKSIVMGRFIGPARSAIPLIAGLLNFGWLRFIIAAAPSAILWSILYIAPGILLGAFSLEFPAKKMTAVIVSGLLCIFLIWFLFWISQLFFKYYIFKLDKWAANLWAKLRSQPRYRQWVWLIHNPQNPNDHLQLTLIFLSALSFVLFLLITLNIAIHGPLILLNQPLFYFLQSLRNHTADVFFVLITLLGSKTVAFGTSIFISLIFFLRKQNAAAIHLLILIFMVCLGVGIGKHLFFSPRPDGFLQVNMDSSFPSGHAVTTLSLFGFLAFLATNYLNRKWHTTSYTIAALLIILVGISRLYLGAHWIADVLGGWMLGLSILFSVIVSYRRQNTVYNTQPGYLFNSVIILSILISWTVAVSLQYKKALKNYSPYYPIQYLAIDEWWQQPAAYTPIYHLNRLGHAVQPYNIQWAAHLNQIKQSLLQQNWQQIINHKHLEKTYMQQFQPHPEYHSTLLPWLFQGQRPALIFIKYDIKQKDLVELRLWSANISFTDSKLPLWIGILTYHSLVKKLLSINAEHPYINLQLNVLLNQSLLKLDHYQNYGQTHYQSKIINIPYSQQPKSIAHLNWDGKILMLRHVE